MMFLKYCCFFLLFLNSYAEFSNTVYQTCSDALLNENVASGIFLIQPFSYGKIANISCKILNNSICEATLDNDAEELVHLNNPAYPSKDTYKKVIKYENFNDELIPRMIWTNDEFSFHSLSNNCYY